MTTRPIISIGFVEALTLLFIAAKLLGHITWSWWWVLVPLWGAWAFFIGIFLIGCFFFGFKDMVNALSDEK